ncbi:N-acetylmuramoyl-L-alanine amidase [Roseibacterium sp. SDUM158016]|uniref:N-acetylmuramoyl-L-alanine amidase n=1 Tax=Roseicyclus sediminis TaxID=2980997 RepID=UPI0021CFA905|nr:N-acetylmuramoyl-L-alanine amidase [Roseibacterium sp. SDUM158016]MCU4651745.1 N-acetylmuramoyl-L-alanine amidase [Roseibacterium sp. SDUM158016]
MRRAVQTILFALVACLSALPLAAQGFGALARVVTEETRVIMAADEGGGVDLTLGLSQPVPFRVFTLADPWRVVLDFREVLWDGLPQGFGEVPGLASVEAGAAYDPGWSRMILTLEAPMLPRIAAMETDRATGAARVRLSLEPAGDAAFLARSGMPPGLAAGIAPSQPAAAGRQDGRLVVVLDPGHGGVDPGAVRGDHTEADLVLTFARELAEALRRTGRAEVVLTREADVFVPLPTRVTLARAAGADALISIHADALAEGRAQGATVYTLAETASDAASAALAEQHDRADILQGIDLSLSDDVVAGVLMDLARAETVPRADALAEGLVEAIAAGNLRLHSRPRMEAGFTVLRAADIPSVLLEIGFMSDAGDLENILDPDWRVSMQAALVAGILDWAETDALRADLLRQ